MSYRVRPGLAAELARFGGGNADKCFNCGNCTAVCSLSEGRTVFPRRLVRFVQLGLEAPLAASVEPWLCYYCGDCATTCPRQAEPARLMMAMRRWLTSRYDFTGLSRRLYLSTRWELGFLAAVALAVALAFVVPADFGFRLLARHPEARDTVMLQWFAPKDVVHWADVTLAVVLASLLAVNAARMFAAVTRGERITVSACLAEAKQLAIHFFTQRSWGECGRLGAPGSSRKHWLRHVVLVTGYGTMLLLVVAFLPWFQVESGGARWESWHWTSLLGYYGTLVLLGATSWLFVDRLRARDPIHAHSHSSDWLFLALLFLTSLTGIAMHLFRLLDVPMATYVAYVVHLAVAVPMLVVEVPFGKWAHLAYRPLAQYLAAVRERSHASVPAPALAHGARSA